MYGILYRRVCLTSTFAWLKSQNKPEKLRVMASLQDHLAQKFYRCAHVSCNHVFDHCDWPKTGPENNWENNS